MAADGAAERAGRQHPDRDGADAGAARVIEQAAEVVGREPGRHRDAGARVQEIDTDLGGVDHAGIEQRVERGGVAQRGDPDEARLALATEGIERRHDLVEDAAQRQPAARPRAALGEDRVVELDEVHPVHGQPPEAGLDAGGDGGGGIGRLRWHAHLGADVRLRAQRPQRHAEVALGLAVAVRGRGVEVVDARLEGARDRPLALGRRAAHDEPADVAAAESQRGDLQSGASERPILHAA